MKAVAYVRVSTDDQVKGTSLDSQVKACKKFAKAEGYELSDSDIFREEGVSAKIMDRPELARMLEVCSAKNREIKACIVWKVDRLARRSEYHHIIKARLAKNGVKLLSVTEPIGDDPTGILMENMLAAFAQFDNEVRTARTTGGMKARTEQGGWPHDAPVGYKKARTASGVSYIEPDEAMSAKVIEFFNKFETGNYNIKQAVELAYDLGIRTKQGKRKSWQSIKDLLKNPLYAGLVRTKYTDGRTLKGLHTPLISEKTHFRVVSIIAGNIKNQTRYAELEWPLRGGYLIHTCGKAMTGSAPRGRSGPSPRYSCPVCHSQPGKATSKKRELVHSEYVNLLNRYELNDSVKRLFKEIVLRRWNQEFKDSIDHNAQINIEIEATREKKSRILDLYIDGKLDDSQKRDKLEEADTAIASLSLQLVEAEQHIKDKESIIDAALLFMSEPGTFWNLGGIEVKKQVQAAVFPEGIEYDFEEGFGTAKLGEAYLLITKLASKDAKNPILVGTDWTNWNRLKQELIRMWQIVGDAHRGLQVIA